MTTPKGPAFHCSFLEPSIALLKFDLPDRGANVLSRAVIAELERTIEELEENTECIGLILVSGKPNIFVAGADLREFIENLSSSKSTNEIACEVEELCQWGRTVFAKLSKGSLITVAAIDGVCVGGGAELAMWCDYRIFGTHPRAEFGLPEVQLGLIPGWGGTARLPRMIGLGNAIPLVTGGESLAPSQCVAMGLAWDQVPSDRLLPSAVALIKQQQKSKGYLAQRNRFDGPVSLPSAEIEFLGATASAVIQQNTKGSYPAPMVALELMLEMADQTAHVAGQHEAKTMATLFGSEVNLALINLFFLTDYNKKTTIVKERLQVADKKKLRKIGVVGLGIMGQGIAAENLKRGKKVAIYETQEKKRSSLLQKVIDLAAFNKDSKTTDFQKGLTLSLEMVSYSDISQFQNEDLVIEAINEDFSAKQRLFEALEQSVSEKTILVTNTSTIPVSEIGAKLRRRDRFAGLHFFNPVHRMKLVEIIQGKETSQETISVLIDYVRSLGKMPIVVQDSPGFLVNRLLSPFLNEALRLLEEGVPLQEIDRAAKRFGMPMGPLELYDMVGLDTALHAGATVMKAFPNRLKVSSVLPTLVQNGRLGKKSGKGFYTYEGKKEKRTIDNGLETILDQVVAPPTEISQKEISNRLIYPMLLEATRTLEDGIVADFREIDLGVVFGLGFPPFRGGLLFWADTKGLPSIVDELKELSESYGDRFMPTTMLQEMAKKRKNFYPQFG
ncbi:MAG: 3-hydroxyacyl-CoA dehydrogenase NAD-binding domain-containing protein [Pirellulaceae bacterium]|nr:3-hydroxyacyl-CoA dehydrogenase NAD-binding domain-containing protein [Pirellulaceae bacterium]